MFHLTLQTTKKDEVIDMTPGIEKLLSHASIHNGICTVFVAHTTCGITTADLDPGTDLDMLDALRAMAPELTYRHPHDPSHASDHILSSLIGSSVTIPFREHELLLGTWQRIVLVELDGPRERNISITFVQDNN